MPSEVGLDAFYQVMSLSSPEVLVMHGNKNTFDAFLETKVAEKSQMADDKAINILEQITLLFSEVSRFL